MATETVRVEQRHIDDGRRNHCYSCPVALALNDATGRRWLVGSASSHEEGVPTNAIKFPGEAIEFIRAFDAGIPVKPLSFKVEVPERTRA